MANLNGPFKELLSSRDFDSFVLDPANPKLVNLIPTAANTTPASLHVLVGVEVKNFLFFITDEGDK
jgi:hypothetical protein